jgi:death-on-curing family protein
MITLTVSEILRLHQKLLDATGGLSGTRDLGLLESAVYSANQVFGEEEAYPTVEQRAARLAYAITQNHPFVDGNKRIGMLVMLMTLRLNHVQIQYTQAELIQLGLSVADNSYRYEDILAWITNHK